MQKWWLFGGLILVGGIIALISLYRASLDGFYGKINLGGKSYINEVNKQKLSYDASQSHCWLKLEKKTVKERLVCGEGLLAKGRVKQGVREIIKSLHLFRQKIRRGECNKTEWVRIKEEMGKILGGVSGNVHELLEREFRAVEIESKTYCNR